MDLPAGVTENEAKEYLSSKVDADLAHLLQEAGTPLGLQYRLTQYFKSVRSLAGYADKRSYVRAVLEQEFGHWRKEQPHLRVRRRT